MDAPGNTVQVLLVSAADQDRVSLEHLFSHSNWSLEQARTCAEAVRRLRQGPAPVVICAAGLPDGDWKAVLAETALHPNPARLIVLAEAAEERLWSEVLELGGYDVLARPLAAPEVVRVVALAWRQWQHEYETRRKPSGVAGGHFRPAARA